MFGWEGVTEFASVAETGSFTGASRQLGISTAQVSRQISALENRLNTKLFYRTTRKVSLTEEGQLYYRHCRQILDSLAEAERAISERQGMPRGLLKLTAPVTYGEQFIMPLINDFMLEYPSIEVTMILTNQTVDLIDGGYDLAIRLGRLNSPSTMVARRLSHRTQFVCAAPEYLEKYGTPHTLSELRHHNCLIGNHDHWHFQEAGRERSFRVTGNLRCNSGNALRDAALKGLGLIQLPDYYISDDLTQGRLIPVLSAFQEQEEGIWVLYPQNRHLSPKVRLLVDFLAERLPRPRPL